jgi:hypothetical protein
MVVLLDTNVVFDVMERRQPHCSASSQVLCLCRRKALVGVVAFHTVANVFYQYGRVCVTFSKERLLLDVEIHGASSGAILDALRWGIRDFEDALQAAAAVAAKASFVITRNVRDFRCSRVPAITAEEFLKRFHPV